MARPVNRLSAAWVAKATTPGLYTDGNGLYLQVSPAGTRSWIYRYRAGAKSHDLGLGPQRLVTLAEARKKALALGLQRLNGIDPLAERRRAKQPQQKDVTFAECAELYIRAKRDGWKGNVSEAQWRASLLTHVFPVIGKLPVRVITTGHVLSVLSPIWTEKTETASRIRQRIEAVLSYAKTAGYRSEDNPATWRGHLENLLARPSDLKKPVHHAALDAAEIPDLLAALRERQAISARALEFLIYTCARSGEVLGATWDEIIGDVWVIPGDRMKSSEEHRVPLSTPAMALLERMRKWRQGPYIFPGQNANRPLNKNNLRLMLASIGRGDVTAHGFRASFSTWAGEHTDFAREIREASLAHRVGDDVERAYRRGTFFAKRRELMEAWAQFCTAPAIDGEAVETQAA
jgi:integrase